jgi:predicted transcriptional regulator
MTDSRDPVRTINDLETLRLIFDPFRLQLLGMMAHEPTTVKQMADELNTTPHRLYYHIRMLEKADVIKVADTRLVNGIVEKFYQTTAIEFIIERGMLNFDTDEGMQGFDVILSEVLDKTREDIKRSGRAGIIDPDEKAPHPDALLLRRGIVYLRPEQAAKVYEEFQRILMEMMSAEPSAEGVKPYIMQFAFYPTKLWDVSDEE